MTTKQGSRWYQRLLLLFWNPGEGRVRAVWRILGAVVIVLVMSSLLTIAIRPLDIPLALTHLVSQGIQALVVLGVVIGWARYVDRRDLRAYGFGLNSRWWRMLALGVFVGLLGWGGALATNIALGWASVSALVSPGTGEIPFLLSLCTFTLAWVFVGFWEEVVFRGIVMRTPSKVSTSLRSRIGQRSSAGGWCPRFSLDFSIWIRRHP